MAITHKTAYKVTGRWPFPLDMLRYDHSAPRTAEDQAKIDRLSVEHPTDVAALREVCTVTLSTELRDYHIRHHAPRWDSFGWIFDQASVVREYSQ